MIEFLNEEVRREFHLLSLERQKDFMNLGQRLFNHKQRVTILCVECWGPNQSEVAIRIDQIFDHVGLGVVP